MRPSRSPSRSDPQGSRAVARRGSGKRRGTTVRVLPPVSRRRCLSDRPWPYVLFVDLRPGRRVGRGQTKGPLSPGGERAKSGRAKHAHPMSQAPHSYKLQHRAPSETKDGSQPPWANPSAGSAWSTATCFSRRGRAVACVSRGRLAYRGSNFSSMVPGAAVGQPATSGPTLAPAWSCYFSSTAMSSRRWRSLRPAMVFLGLTWQELRSRSTFIGP